MIAPVSYPHVSRPQTQRSSETSPSEPILARRPIRAHRSRTVSRGDLAICRAGKGAHAEIEGSSYSLRKPGITDVLVVALVRRAPMPWRASGCTRWGKYQKARRSSPCRDLWNTKWARAVGPADADARHDGCCTVFTERCVNGQNEVPACRVHRTSHIADERDTGSRYPDMRRRGRAGGTLSRRLGSSWARAVWSDICIPSTRTRCPVSGCYGTE